MGRSDPSDAGAATEPAVAEQHQAAVVAPSARADVRSEDIQSTHGDVYLCLLLKQQGEPVCFWLEDVLAIPGALCSGVTVGTRQSAS